MNIIVKGATTLQEYKAKRAAIRKMAETFSEGSDSPPETAWIDDAILHVKYKNGVHRRFTATGKEV